MFLDGEVVSSTLATLRQVMQDAIQREDLAGGPGESWRNH